ncbi:spermidine synthase [Candidatus Omnitrophota bacterium]
MHVKRIVIRVWVYYTASFLAAFLLFQIQPMIAKAVLPHFGGSYLVWAASMMLFQALLLLGYFYAHSVQRWLGVLTYSRWHLILLALPFIMFPFRFSNLYGIGYQQPLFIVVPYLLAINVGIPFFVLATASLILQSWFYKSNLPDSSNPYKLYAASNVGSVCGLLSYPIIFEPTFTLQQQGYVWWLGYGVLIGLFILCRPRGAQVQKQQVETQPLQKESLRRVVCWFTLSAAGTFSLLTVTNLLTFDIAAVPFLWVLPLSVYLMTFVVAFKRNPWFPGWMSFAFICAITLGVIFYFMTIIRLSIPIFAFLPFQLVLLFILCLNCHGHLIKNKPVDTRNLTVFYLFIAAGGFFGSFLVSSIIPLVTNSLLEYPLSFLFCALAIAMASDQKINYRTLILHTTTIVAVIVIALSLTAVPQLLNNVLHLPLRISFLIVAALLLIAVMLLTEKKPWRLVFVLIAVLIFSQWTEYMMFGMVHAKRFRNFYGMYNIYNVDDMRYLYHGSVQHGRQYCNTEKSSIPLAYFHPTTPIGELLSQKAFSLHAVGMIGLGTGAISAYMAEGQTFTIFELDPDCAFVAEKFFTYLKTARENGAKLQFVFGDGRISLRKQPKHSLDMLIIDAFNSGSIPVHLVTREAIQEYFSVLKPDGILLMHISNSWLDLHPVIYSIAQDDGLYACEKTNALNLHEDASFTMWMVLSKDTQKYQMLIQRYQWISRRNQKEIYKRPWSDHYTNLLSVFKWSGR